MDKTTPKYKIALELMNKILTNNGKSNIDDLTKFNDFDRELIITDKNKKDFNDMQKKLFGPFDKAKSGWYKRNSVKHYILTFLRYMCSDLGLSFTYEQRDITSNINGSNYRKTHTFYSIKL